MVKYSLKEFLYWLTIWIVGVSLVFPVVLPVFFRSLALLWLGGTIIVIKVLGERAAFWYSAVFGYLFLVAATPPAVKSYVQPQPSNIELRFVLCIPLGLIAGSIVWGIVVGADRLFNRLSP